MGSYRGHLLACSIPFLARFHWSFGKHIPVKDTQNSIGDSKKINFNGHAYQIAFQSAYTRCSLGLLFYITCMYTKLVVIVNKRKFVDKSVYLIDFNDLSDFEVPVQLLYQLRTAIGQIFDCVQGARFCTTGPVDIQ